MYIVQTADKKKRTFENANERHFTIQKTRTAVYEADQG